MVQIRDILTSDDANVVLIYKWYCLNSFFCLFLFSLAAWKPRLPYLSFIAFVLTTLRAEVRMLDLELSHQTNFVYWFTICVYNTASVIVNMFILTTHFKYKKARNMTVTTLVVIQQMMVYRGILTIDKDYDFFAYLKQWGIVTVFFIIVMYS